VLLLPKIAVISDIHSNLEALMAVWDDIRQKDISFICCCGDILGYGPNPVQTAEFFTRYLVGNSNGNWAYSRNNTWQFIQRHWKPWIRAQEVVSVTGNYDVMVSTGETDTETTIAHEPAKSACLWTIDQLSRRHNLVEIIGALEPKVSLALRNRNDVRDTMLCHGRPSPYTSIARKDYLDTEEKAVSSFAAMNAWNIFLSFVGHTHVPEIWEVPIPLSYDPRAMPAEREVTLAIDTRIREEEMVHYKARDLTLHKARMYIVNVGSVGQPRDHDPRACYVIYDTETHSIEFRRIEYNTYKTAGKIIMTGLRASRSIPDSQDLYHPGPNVEIGWRLIDADERVEHGAGDKYMNYRKPEFQGLFREGLSQIGMLHAYEAYLKLHPKKVA